MSPFAKRLASAAVLLPAVVAVVVAGDLYFVFLVAAFAGIMAWEWARICVRDLAGQGAVGMFRPVLGGLSPIEFFSISNVVIGLFAVGAIAALAGDEFGYFVNALILASTVTASVALAWPVNRRRAIWLGLGMGYVMLPAFALLSLRADPESGMLLVLWVIGLTVAADTLAYVAGRGIGGPKLAPRISPNKTWAGLGGAIVGAALAGAIASIWLNPAELWKITALSALLGVVEQGGDLVESAFKRHFGVKDSSQVIPGHGGMLDRVDGLLAVAVAVVAIDFLGGARFLHGVS